MTNFHIVFIPSPGVGHLYSAVEFAKLLVNRDDRLSITVFIMNFPSDKDQTVSFPSSPRLKFVNLVLEPSTAELFVSELVELNKPRVRDYVSSEANHVSAFLVDMFCMPFLDLANEFNLPTYAYFTSSTGFLSLIFQLQILEDEDNQDIYKFKHSDAELSVPGFSNHVPARVLPAVIIDKDLGFPDFLDVPRRLRKAKGILVNTFMELESNVITSLSNENKVPRIYPVGPLLASIKKNEDETEKTRQGVEDIMSWLDIQPSSSVVLLCFGSRGCFEKEQVVEIANALENSGHRFLWSLRRPPKGKREFPTEYENLYEVVPEGFLDRTSEKGKMVGWIPQKQVLSHPAVGGFVSHCGWNSTLESLSYGVPLATWPLYAEQKINAFALIKELGLAVEIKMDYDKDFIVSSDKIEKGIRELMDDKECLVVRNKVKEMSEKSKLAIESRGSSHNALGSFIEDLVRNPN